MSVEVVTGLLLIALPVLFNVSFAALAKLFDYPDVLRRPTVEILAAFEAGGERLLLAWWAFASSAVLFIPAAVLLADVLALATAIGVAAGIAQAVGLLRWPFAVPYLARHREEPGIDAAFQAIHRALGVGVGEHLGYLLTGAWTLFAGIAMTQSPEVPDVLGLVAIAISPLFAIGALEFVGKFERDGWKLAGDLVPLAYVVWSLWLLATGIALLA
jgi:hypothetical protein